jgi:hypothetical protein
MDTFDPEHFRSPPTEYSPLPFWMINKIPGRGEVARQLEEMHKKGVMQFLIHPRRGLDVPVPIRPPRMPVGVMVGSMRRDKYFTAQRKKHRTIYLGGKWWRIVDDILTHARSLQMDVWIYDELDWPSGTAGMSIPVKYPETKNKYMVYSTVLGRRRRRRRGKNLNFNLREDDDYIDVLSTDATEKFIELTHQEYYKRYGDAFGTHIKGFYSDEVTLMHHFKILKSFRKNYIPWTPLLAEAFREDHGYDLMEELHLLVEDLPDSARVRCDFWNTLSKLYTQNFHGALARWCTERSVLYTGHLLCEEPTYMQVVCQGNIFDALRTFDIPGIDHLGLWVGGGHPRIASSAAHHKNTHEKRVLCEAFGASGWGLTIEDMRRITNWLYVNGINLLNPHAFYMSTEGFRKMDYPPSQFFQAPYWDDYHKFSNRVRRMSYTMSCGVHEPDVALYYPVTSLFAHFNFTPFAEMVNLIMNELDFVRIALGMVHLDFDFVDDKILTHARCRHGYLQIGEERYCTLILPCVTTLSADLKDKIDDAIANEVRVIFTTLLPYQGSDINDAEVKKWSKSQFNIEPLEMLKRNFRLKVPLLAILYGLAPVLGRINFDRMLMSLPNVSSVKVYTGGGKPIGNIDIENYNKAFISTSIGFLPTLRNARLLAKILGTRGDLRITPVRGKTEYLRLYRRRCRNGKLYLIMNLSPREIIAKLDFPEGRLWALDFDTGAVEAAETPVEIAFNAYDAHGFLCGKLFKK